MWSKVHEYIHDHEKFVVTTHVHPDGDAVGSEIALAAFLESLGKRVSIINSSPTARNNAFLDPRGKIMVYPGGGSARALEGAEVAFILDVNNWPHLGAFGEALRKSNTPRICIDHHQGADVGFADVVVSDTTAAATGLLMYELILAMKGEITTPIADAVFATLVTDTGTFRFSNTDERVFRAAADLCARGVEPFAIHRRVFSKTGGAVRLLGAVLRTLSFADDGKIAWIHASREMFAAAEADYEDSDGILDVVRAVEGVEYCLFFKGLGDGKVKISLRSNGKVDVHQIAKTLGGGGHRMAAGVTVDGPIDGAIASVVKTCAETFRP
ncbi:MAG: bifunctional oligoribonuclease/PAP phosphatase NrnA [Candidatus Krumholzibacteriia bacterium]